MYATEFHLAWPNPRSQPCYRSETPLTITVVAITQSLICQHDKCLGNGKHTGWLVWMQADLVKKVFNGPENIVHLTST